MSQPRKRIVIIGATSAIAGHCARQWIAAAPADLVLVSRDQTRAEQVAADLWVRSPSSHTEARSVGFDDPLAIQRLADDIAAGGVIDIVLIAHGSLPSHPACQRDLLECQDMLLINGVSPVLFAEAFAGHLERRGHGTLALIGSVAGDRGRRSNYVYGAAKGLVEHYVQGLQHRFAGSGVRAVLVKPGPTDTPMTAALRQQGARLASVEAVAERIVAGIARGRPVIYAPAQWALIMLVIRHLPRFIFNRLDI